MAVYGTSGCDSTSIADVLGRSFINVPNSLDDSISQRLSDLQNLMQSPHNRIITGNIGEITSDINKSEDLE